MILGNHNFNNPLFLLVSLSAESFAFFLFSNSSFSSCSRINTKETDANSYYMLAKTLTTSSSIFLLDQREMTVQALLVKAIELDGDQSEYYTALAATMKTDATIQIDRKAWTYTDVLDQARR